MAIEFSTPSSAFKNIKRCMEHKVPVICGTTGWLDKFEETKILCNKYNSAFLYASNFSIGVNIFFELNKKLSILMKDKQSYKVSMEETHHLEKLDKPSGTAITLAEHILEHNNKDNWSISNNTDKDIYINCKREDNVIGSHSIKYSSPIDEIEISHKAKNREGFALGAVIASEWILKKKGIFTMKDVIGI